MARTPNIVRRGTTYHFRRAIPQRLRAAFGAREFVRTLATSDFRLACVRSRQVYVALEECFDKLVAAPMLTDHQIQAVVDDFKKIFLLFDQSQRILGPISEEERSRRASSVEAEAVRLRHEAARGDHTRAQRSLDIMIPRHRLELTNLELRILGHALLLAHAEIRETQKERFEGNFGGEYGYGPWPLNFDQLHQQPPQDRSEPAQGFVDHAEAAVTAKFPGSDELFSSLSLRFIADQVAGSIWSKQTTLQARKTYALAVEILGDRTMGSYSQADAEKFKNQLQSLPADYGKAAMFKGLAVEEIVKADKTRRPNAERLSNATVKRHVNALGALFKWAGREHPSLANPFLGLRFPSAKLANQERDMWTSEELQSLFSSPVWRGCKSVIHRMSPGDTIIRDEKFWLPLIALFSGMRQEEICQLQTEDIRQIDGSWCFDINGRSPRKIKNKNAVRRVPVHSTLKEMGLIALRDERRSAGEKMMFAGLSPGGADDRLGHAFSKWFTRYRKAVGVYRRGLDFHSLRHTATTLMDRANVPAGTIDEVTGHASPGETARYTKRRSIKQLAGAIESIAPQLDRSHLHC
jgi:integrase